jgi:molybdopterin-containing oxidoreductase family membrane subunit
MNKVILVTGFMVGYSYIMEAFFGWYSANEFERYMLLNRKIGPYAWSYWLIVACNFIIPQLFWSKKIRRSIPVMFAIAVFVNIGMWFERFVITITSLHRDYLPSSWDMFIPTLTDFAILIGSFGFFFTFLLLFTKALPVVSISEVKAVVDGSQPSHHKEE